jgi:type IX secretion system PorP/SprF family membrane protein
MKGRKQHIRSLIKGPLLLLLLAFAFIAEAQQDPHYSQYIFNGLSLNPAYAGSRGTVSGMFFYRNQWTGFNGAPVTQAFSLHTPIQRGHAGVGLNLVNDKIGYMGQQWVTASYAYILSLGGSNRLAFGLRGGFMNFKIHWDEVRVSDLQDPILASNARSMMLPNVGTGLYFSNNRMYVGLSMPHILNSPLRRDQGSLAVAHLYRHAYLTAGYVFGINNSVQWKPSILLKYAPGAPLELDVNLMALFAQKFWVGVSWRSRDAVAFMLDFQIAKQFRMGYAFDYSTTELRKYHNGTHEILLGFELYSKHAKMKSPRYF